MTSDTKKKITGWIYITGVTLLLAAIAFSFRVGMRVQAAETSVSSTKEDVSRVEEKLEKTTEIAETNKEQVVKLQKDIEYIKQSQDRQEKFQAEQRALLVKIIEKLDGR